MGLANSSRIFETRLTDFSGIEKDFRDHFELNGYTVESENTATGLFLSMTKGGTFQKVAGLQTGLNINIRTEGDRIVVSMEVGAFGKRILPTAIGLLVAWPLLLPEIYGLIQQNKLDEEAYRIIGEAIKKYDGTASAPVAVTQVVSEPEAEAFAFCTACGAKVPADSAFCLKCGAKIE